MCKIPKSSNADKQRDFLCLTNNVTLFVVTDDRLENSHFTDGREEEGFRALEIDTIIRKKLLFRVLKINRGRVVV